MESGSILNHLPQNDRYQLELLEQEYRELTEDYVVSFSVAILSDRLKKEQEILKIRKQAYRLSQPYTENNQPYCFILVASKKEVKENLTENVFDLLPIDRYHDDNRLKWMPFVDEGSMNIDEIVKCSKAARFSQVIIAEPQNLFFHEQLKEKKDRSIVIIDAFSLYEDYLLIATRIDSTFYATARGVLLPICETTLNRDKTLSLSDYIHHPGLIRAFSSHKYCHPSRKKISLADIGGEELTFQDKLIHRIGKAVEMLFFIHEMKSKIKGSDPDLDPSLTQLN